MRIHHIVLSILLAGVAAGCATRPVEPAPSATAGMSGAAPAAAAPAASTCEDEFLAERLPVLADRPPAADLTDLCFTHFAVLYSGARRGPLWSAYRLTKTMSDEADAFKNPRPPYQEEMRLSKDHRSHEKDFEKNDYDVGHMTPNKDMPNERAQLESFSMANMSPQIDSLNSGAWKSLEKSVHDRAQVSGPLYIVTGPIFAANPPLMNGRVAIPKSFFKAIYDAKTDTAIVFIFDNKKGATCEILTIAKLDDIAGIDAFPTLAGDARKAIGTWRGPKACKNAHPES